MLFIIIIMISYNKVSVQNDLNKLSYHTFWFTNQLTTCLFVDDSCFIYVNELIVNLSIYKIYTNKNDNAFVKRSSTNVFLNDIITS